jgi:5-methylcytosine-specific restriction endonuclease McrA
VADLIAQDDMEKRTCTFPGCGKPEKARGWCTKHYQRWKKHGDPALTADTRQACLGCGGPVRARNPFGYCRKNPECAREYARLWRDANADRQRMLHERWRQVNQDRVREAERAWALANRSKKRAACVRWRAAYPDRAAEAVNRWIAANGDRIRETRARRLARLDRPCGRGGCGEFAAPNRHYCRHHATEADARRYARIVRKVTTRLYECQHGLCPGTDHGGCGLPLGQPAGNHVDHVIPQSLGGPDEDWNLQLMHPVCNLRKHDKIVRAAFDLAAEHGVKFISAA